MKIQFLDGVGDANAVSSYINSGASAVSSIANLVSAAKGTGVTNLTQQPATTTKTVIVSPSNNANNNSTALLQQQLLLQQAAAAQKSNTGLSTNAIIGIAVGGVAVLGVILVVAMKK